MLRPLLAITPCWIQSTSAGCPATRGCLVDEVLLQRVAPCISVCDSNVQAATQGSSEDATRDDDNAKNIGKHVGAAIDPRTREWAADQPRLGGILWRGGTDERSGMAECLSNNINEL